MKAFFRCSFLLLAAAAVMPAADSNSVLIRNVTVHPVTSPDIQSGSVLVLDGKIAEVGAKIAPRGGTRVVDGHGQQSRPSSNPGQAR